MYVMRLTLRRDRSSPWLNQPVPPLSTYTTEARWQQQQQQGPAAFVAPVGGRSSGSPRPKQQEAARPQHRGTYPARGRRMTQGGAG